MHIQIKTSEDINTPKPGGANISTTEPFWSFLDSSELEYAAFDPHDRTHIRQDIYTDPNTLCMVHGCNDLQCTCDIQTVSQSTIITNVYFKLTLWVTLVPCTSSFQPLNHIVGYSPLWLTIVNGLSPYKTRSIDHYFQSNCWLLSPMVHHCQLIKPL